MTTKDPTHNLLVPEAEPWNKEAPIIELENVTKSFNAKKVLDNLSLSIETGKTTVVIGTSGSGKSVLIKHMNGLFLPDEGSVRIFGRDTTELNEVELDNFRKRIGTLFQNYALIDSKRVLENVMFPLVENRAVSFEKAKTLATELLEDLGLENALNAFPASLSGGMKKRVSLARAIIHNPDVVLFDEPTTGLDPILVEYVDGLIEDLAQKYGFTSLIISHDLVSVFRLADKIAVLHNGQIIEEGKPRKIKNSENDIVQSLLSTSDHKTIDADSAADRVSAKGTKSPAIELRDVEKSFGKNHVLKKVNLTVPTNKTTVIIGGSGAGKSVIMKHILGLMQPDSGDIRVFGDKLTNLTEPQLRRIRTRIGMLFQHSALFDSITVAENIAFPLLERWLPDLKPKRWDRVESRVEKLLEQLQIESLADTLIQDLSSGQRKRVALARALITDPELIIYDEPTTGQDPILSQHIENMIAETQQNYELTSLIISHDMASAFRLADQIALLHKGEMIISGPPQKLLESDDERVRQFIFASEPKRRDNGDN